MRNEVIKEGLLVILLLGVFFINLGVVFAESNLTFISQSPGDINTFNIFGTRLNISYNLSGQDINFSTVELYYKTNSSTSDCLFYLNGSLTCGYHSGNITTNNVSQSWYFLIGDNKIYPAIYNFDETQMESQPHIRNTLVSSADYIAIQMLI